MPKFHVQVIHRQALHWRELSDALRRIEESDAIPTAKLAIRMLAFTATHSNEVRGMRWDEVDGATWTIPSSRVKTKREHRVPLSTEAMAVLIEARQWRVDGCGLVFPNTRSKPFADSALMVPVRKLGGGWTLHGMRSTFRTWCDELGHDGQLAEFSLGHVVGSKVEMAYRRGDLYERRALLMAEWGRVIGN